MSFFFNDNIDPNDMAATLVMTVEDFMPTGDEMIDAYLARVIDSYNEKGGIKNFAGDPVDFCEDIEVALEMVIQRASDSETVDMAQMALCALSEARGAWGVETVSLEDAGIY